MSPYTMFGKLEWYVARLLFMLPKGLAAVFAWS